MPNLISVRASLDLISLHLLDQKLGETNEIGKFRKAGAILEK